MHIQTYRAPRLAAGEELKVRTMHRARHEGLSASHNYYITMSLTSCLRALYFPGCSDEDDNHLWRAAENARYSTSAVLELGLITFFNSNIHAVLLTLCALTSVNSLVLFQCKTNRLS